MLAGPFDRPIPGQSLTTEPRNNPWEQPPQIADKEEVLKYYVGRLANQEVIDDMAAMCEAGIPLQPLVESITTMGVMRGIHTVDVSMLVGPDIHAFLKQSIEAMGIKVRDDGRDRQAEAEQKEMDRFVMLATKYLEENPDDEDPGKQMLGDMVEAAEPEEEVTPEDKPQGLMAKG